jgi:hypothetical protein
MNDSDFEIIEVKELEEIKKYEREKQELLKSEIILNELDDITEPVFYDDTKKTIQITFVFHFFDFSFKLILPPDEYKNLYKISKLLSNIFDRFKCEIEEL